MDVLDSETFAIFSKLRLNTQTNSRNTRRIGIHCIYRCRTRRNSKTKRTYG